MAEAVFDDHPLEEYFRRASIHQPATLSANSPSLPLSVAGEVQPIPGAIPEFLQEPDDGEDECQEPLFALERLPPSLVNLIQVCLLSLSPSPHVPVSVPYKPHSHDALPRRLCRAAAAPPICHPLAGQAYTSLAVLERIYSALAARRRCDASAAHSRFQLRNFLANQAGSLARSGRYIWHSVIARGSYDADVGYVYACKPRPVGCQRCFVMPLLCRAPLLPESAIVYTCFHDETTAST